MRFLLLLYTPQGEKATGRNAVSQNKSTAAMPICSFLYKKYRRAMIHRPAVLRAI